MSRGGRRGFLVRARECCDLIGHRLPHLQLLKILGSQQQKDLPADVPLHLIRTMEVTTVQGPKWTYQCRSEFCRAARPRKLDSTRVGKWFFGDRLITIGEVDDEGLGLACLWTLAGSVVVGLWLRRFSSSGWRTKACGDLVVQWLRGRGQDWSLRTALRAAFSSSQPQP